MCTFTALMPLALLIARYTFRAYIVMIATKCSLSQFIMYANGVAFLITIRSEAGFLLLVKVIASYPQGLTPGTAECLLAT